MKAKLLALAFVSLFFSAAMVNASDPASLSFRDTIDAATISVTASAMSFQAGSEIALNNYTNQGFLFTLEDGSEPIYVKALSSATFKAAKSGKINYTVYHGASADNFEYCV